MTQEELEKLARNYEEECFRNDKHEYISVEKERRKGFIAGYTTRDKESDCEIELFSNWLSDTGWIRRPFAEESEFYLYDDHGVGSENFNYDNGKSFAEVLELFKNREVRNVLKKIM